MMMMDHAPRYAGSNKDASLSHYHYEDTEYAAESVRGGIRAGQNNDNNDDDDDAHGLVAQEDKWIFGLRVLTVFILALVTTTVCVGVYMESRRSERDDFVNDFIDIGEKLVASFGKGVQQRLESLKVFHKRIRHILLLRRRQRRKKIPPFPS